MNTAALPKVRRGRPRANPFPDGSLTSRYSTPRNAYVLSYWAGGRDYDIAALRYEDDVVRVVDQQDRRLGLFATSEAAWIFVAGEIAKAVAEVRR